jgi:hypothetical protein
MERKLMKQALEQRLREALGDIPAEDVHAIVAFAQFLFERRQAEQRVEEEVELSDMEHGSILRILDAVAELSTETGPPVSNRDHDRYLYGEN